MKKSVIWRFVIIGLILGVWFASIFPYQDRPFLKILQQEAKGKDKVFDELITETKKVAKEQQLPIPKALERVANIRKIDLTQYIKLVNKPNATNRDVIAKVRRLAKGKLKLGLDLRGGTEFTIAFNPKDIPKGKTVDDVRDDIIEILRNRIDASGVMEPEIKPEGDIYISVKIPTISQDEILKFKKILQQQAKLTFHLVGDASKKDDPSYESKEIRDENGVVKETILMKRRAEPLDGHNLTRAFPSMDQFGNYYISLTFDSEGAKKFYDITRKYVHRRLAIVLDNTVYSAPVIQNPIPTGSAQITGNFSLDEAKQLAIVLRCGNLPVDIRIQAEQSTDPTLGADSVKSGRNAALIGLVIVVLFMAAYYLIAGVIADIALAANIVLVLGTLTIAGATITLPGIAGVVLTIGMAVDANVLIFERIREELLNGKSLANSIHNGYDRAFLTIIDANLTTLITAFILYRFGAGAIRGFAVTLTIGILASMFTALFMTRTIFDLLLLSPRFKNLRMMYLIRRPKFDFLGKRKIAGIISTSLIVIGLVNMLIRGSHSLSVDFTGGTAVTYNYTVKPGVGEIRKALTQAGYKDVRITYKRSVEASTRLLEVVVNGIEAKKDPDVKGSVAKVLNHAFPQAKFRGGSTRQIGGLVGKKFRKDTLIAMILAIIGIIIYIAMRFEFSYAMGAVIALVHDVFIGAGLYLLFIFGERQISMPVVAALLTIMGYSLNDTIVVFDRIRENLGLYSKKRRFLDIVNASINDTLSRTLLTSLTTLFVVLALFFLGGGAINDFALVMLIGIVVGTYSSIFIATPVMIWYRHRQERKKAEHAEAQSA